jgi:hypothetical protein
VTRKMVALVIGNAAYPDEGVLRNPANDADDMAKKLRSFGFEVILARNASNKQMDKALKTFKERLDENDVGLFFFAGHGMQLDERNYLLAIDTDMTSETDAKHSSLSLDRVIDTMDKSSAATKIIVLDACRNNPWERAWKRAAGMRGLASVYAPKGTIIGFATSPGQFASDGKGRNGTYTDALLQHIDAPDCPIETMFKRVRNTVAAETHGKQISWEHTSLSGNFFFNMSLGSVLKDYPESSLADSLFVIDGAKPSHKIIKGLKSYNYYAQNDALALLTSESVKKMGVNNLFVLGRNIYQAACGGSNAAIAYVLSFTDQTADFHKDKRKAILDGMIFEIFFDRDAKLRSEIKGKYFDELFELQKNAVLRESFDFISEALVASRGNFYAVPGRNHELAVTVGTKLTKDCYRVETVYVDGADVLHADDEEYADDDLDARMYSRRTPADFEEKLSQELMIPSRLLKVTYTPRAAGTAKLQVPYGYTVRKSSS